MSEEEVRQLRIDLKCVTRQRDEAAERIKELERELMWLKWGNPMHKPKEERPTRA